jgi:general secretion pathway protein G
MTHSFSHSRRRSAAFTLVEIVLVLAIIALLLGVAVKGVQGVLEHGKNVAAKADVDTFNTLMITYQSMALRYPTSEQGLKALVDKPSSGPQPRQWRRLSDSVKPDPWGNEYRYAYPGKHNTTVKPDIWSIGPDFQDGTEDDIGNWEQ